MSGRCRKDTFTTWSPWACTRPGGCRSCTRMRTIPLTTFPNEESSMNLLARMALVLPTVLLMLWCFEATPAQDAKDKKKTETKEKKAAEKKAAPDAKDKKP